MNGKVCPSLWYRYLDEVSNDEAYFGPSKNFQRTFYREKTLKDVCVYCKNL